MIHLLFFLLPFLIDMMFLSIFPIDFASARFILVPSTTFIFFIYTTRFYSVKKAVLIGSLLGLWMDLFLYQELFVLASVFALVTLIIKQWSKHLSDSMFETMTLGVLALFLKELFLYIMLLLMGETRWQFMLWMAHRLFPTLIVALFSSIFIFVWFTIYEQTLLDITQKIRRKEKLRWYQNK